jgi:peptide/nickel transport system permease protein
MVRFIFRRALVLIPLLLLVATMVFMLVHLTPGDPATVLAGDTATLADVQAMRQALGLDRPLPEQYWRFLSGLALHLDMGTSIFLKQPVTRAVADRMEPTLMLTFIGGLFSILLGIPLGVVAAVRHNGFLDRLFMVIALLGLSIPSFWLGINLSVFFGLWLNVLPVAGYVSLSAGLWKSVSYLLLPSFALGFSSSALIARMIRSSMLDVLRLEYIRTARAKGLAERLVIYRHALKNAMLPTLTVIGLSIAGLAGGAVVIETIFSIPGVGMLVINAISRRDYPVIQGVVLFSAFLYVLINLTLDVLYAYINPQVRYQ